MSWKTIVKHILPPIVLKAYRGLQNPYKAGYLWNGVYSAFDEVPAQGGAFQGDVWLDSRTDLTKYWIRTLAQSRDVPPVMGFRYGSLAMLASLVLQKRKRARIVDFGGAMGITFPQVAKSVIGSDGVDYTVVDNKESCARGRALFPGEPRIRFVPSLDDTITTADIVFVSGALQYVSEYARTLQRLAALRPEFMLFTCLYAGEIPTFVTAQQNLKGSVFPVWFFNLSEFTSILQGLGYTLIFNARIESEDVLSMENFPEKMRLSHAATLLFSKAQPDATSGIGQQRTGKSKASRVARSGRRRTSTAKPSGHH